VAHSQTRKKRDHNFEHLTMNVKNRLRNSLVRKLQQLSTDKLNKINNLLSKIASQLKSKDKTLKITRTWRDKIIAFCYFMFCSSALSFSQQFPDTYFEAISKADSLIINKDYKAAAMHYDSIFKSYEGKGTRFNRYIAAYLWNMAGNTDSALYYLFDVANEGSYYTISLALKNKAFKNLQEDARWEELQMKINNNKAYLENVVPSGYVRIVKYGFEILLNQFALQNYKSATDSALLILDKDLLRISNFKMKKSALDALKRVRIFLDWDTGHPTAQVHPSEDWLIQNGYIPEKVKQLEISNMRNYMNIRNQNQPLIIMHEMTHTYHEKLTDEQKKVIKDTYANAMQKNLYQSVDYSHGDGSYDYNVTAYASTDEFEYFAEITTAYFGACMFYPFNKKDLKKYDKAGYKLVKTLWVKEK
jgi:hypothetical protein